MLTVIRWQEMHRRQRRRLRIRRQTIHRRQERSRLRWLRRRRQLTPAGRRQSHQQYHSRVMNPSVSGDGWSERHERRETVGSKSDTAEGEGGWWREQPHTVIPHSCRFHVVFIKVPACGCTFSDGIQHDRRGVQLFGQSIAVKPFSQSSTRNLHRACTKLDTAQEPNRVP